MLKNLAYLAAFTTFVVLVWIGLSIYNSVTSSTLTQAEAVQVVPLTPTFNTKVIDSLKTRIQIPVNLSDQIATSSAQSTQAATPTAAPTQPIISVTPIPSLNPTVIPSPVVSTQPQQQTNDSNVLPTPTSSL